MSYHGNNPLGRALARDPQGLQRDAVLQALTQLQAQAEQHLRFDDLPPDTYQMHQAAVDSAALCIRVVTEFHAVCNAVAR